MENWELDFEWLQVRHMVKDSFQKEDLPDLQSILFLIGVQELGKLEISFSKEEKQDLMHIAVCTLLSQDGYYEFIGRDDDGWPHFKQIRKMDFEGVKEQEQVLKKKILEYFNQN